MAKPGPLVFMTIEETWNRSTSILHMHLVIVSIALQCWIPATKHGFMNRIVLEN
jgi:hypothetical protein